MLENILLGWITGIAFMGLDLPFVTTTWWMWLVLAIAVFAYGFYDRRRYFNNPMYKALILISVGWALFCTGFDYADTALEQRLKLREVKAQPFEAVVYIKKLDELSDEGQKQIAEVLNRHEQPVDWFLYLSKEKNKQFKNKF